MKKVMLNQQGTTESLTETPALRRATRAGLARFFSKTTLGALAVLLGVGVAALAAESGTDNRAPDVPVDITVPVGNKVHFHGFAVGFQVYTWDGVSWGRAVPDATLFDDDGNVVATHFAGPRWKSNSGSVVLGALAKPPVTVDTNSIPWLLLSAVPAGTHGPGIFADTSYIHRVNTAGGKEPPVDGSFVGQVARQAYTADYFFYRMLSN